MATWRHLLDAAHPVWRLAQGIVAIVGIWVAAAHGHAGGVDASDAAGVGGAALAGRLAWLWIRR